MQQSYQKRDLVKLFSMFFDRILSEGASVAQWIEHFLRTEEVAGSNPAGGTTLVALRNFCAGPLLIEFAVAVTN